jgi:outer membrane receptor protein involved in Fe transport
VLASAISAVLASSGAAFAQEPDQGDQLEEVLVTGSRIVRRDFSANSPIMTVDSEMFQQSSTVAMETVLNQLPQFVPAVTQFQPVPPGELSNSGDPGVTPTAATVSLRGLGSNRNLVLLDGRRATPIDASMAVDINAIPAAAIARVESITGGASSVYGADAVAGVVNFILKDDLEGFAFDVHYGQTERGDAEEQAISAVFGTNFGNNGNIMIGIEKYDRGRVLQQDREFYTEGWADPASQGGIQVFYTAPYFSNAGANPFSQGALDTVFGGSVSAATGFGNYYLNEDGSVYRTSADGNTRYNGPTLTADGDVYRFVRADNGVLSENWVDEQNSAPIDRQSMFGRAIMDITDNVAAFAQLMFAESSGQYRRRVGGMVGGWGGTVPHGDRLYEPSLLDDGVTTNPDYLAGGRHGLSCDPTGGCTVSEAWPKSPEAQLLLDSRPDREAPATVGTATTWFGNVKNDVWTRTHQVVAGLEGVLPARDWTWELYVSSGATTTENEYVGTTSTQRWRYVISQPNYGAGLFQIGNQEGGGFGAGVMECTSGFAYLGQGERYYLDGVGYSDAAPSEDCQRAVGATLAAVGRLTQDVGEFNLQGSIAELPAGQLSFAIGASYRENDFRWYPPPINTPESIFDLPAGQYPRSTTIGTIDSAELYGELLVPLVRDKAFAEAMNLELGYRRSNNDPSEDVDTYKALLDWQVHPRVRIRGGHQVANRAPNVAELFQQGNQRLIVGSQGDWCSDLNPVNPFSPNPALNPNAAQARALCETLMTSVGAQEFYNNPNRPAGATGFFWAFVDGNLAVGPETAGTTTIGTVVDVTDQFTLTVDYWAIKIDDMISSEDPNQLYRQCLDPATNPTFDVTFAPCQQIQRDPFNGTNAIASLLYTNEGAVDFAGYDIQTEWTRDLGPGVFNLNSVVTINDRTKTRVSPEAEWTDWTGTSGPADITGLNGYAYDFRTHVTANYSQGRWGGTLRWRHLPSIESSGTVNNPVHTFEPTGSYNMFDFSGRYSSDGPWMVRFGIDNLFDADPERTFPEATNTATGQTNANFYDILGRRYYVAMSLQF